MSDPRLPLEGVVVVTVEQAVAAPFATRQLADLGARVIKVERRGAGDFARGYDEVVDGLSSAFLWLNRGKESVTLDLKRRAGRSVLGELLDACDVFVHNLSPRAARRAGIDTATLLADHDRMIPCAISGYGKSGPLSDAKAYDLLVQGETGIVSLTGHAEQMAKVGISIADISAGMYAYSAILAALFHRQRTGEVLPVDVSLFDSLTEWLAYPMYYTMYGGVAPRRMGTHHATIAPYGAFETVDGRLLVAVQNDREWRRFCEVVLGEPSLADDPLFMSHHRRVANRNTLDQRVAERFASMDLESALDLLSRADIACSRLNDISALADHDQLVERSRWVDTDSPVGSVRTVLPPWLPAHVEPDLGAVPDVGAHTDDVLRWLGHGAAKIDRLRRDQAI
ncbi:MAG: CaiB/BaiF CoA transferase family protein [Nocardioidaceae bacterium]